MKILDFSDLGKVFKSDILELKEQIKEFLSGHPGIVFAAFYGGTVTDEYDEFSDIDVFVIFYNFSFIEDLHTWYRAKGVTFVDIEWKLIPLDLLSNGFATDSGYLSTIQMNHELIIGNQKFFMNLQPNRDRFSGSILRRITKSLDKYVKPQLDFGTTSQMLRGIDHVPMKVITYCGTSKKECQKKYLEYIKGDSGIKDLYENIRNLPNRYRDYARTTLLRGRKKDHYDAFVMKMQSYLYVYALWLTKTFIFEENKETPF